MTTESSRVAARRHRLSRRLRCHHLPPPRRRWRPTTTSRRWRSTKTLMRRRPCPCSSLMRSAPLGTRRAHGGEGCDGMSRCRGVQRSTVGARKPPSSTRRTTKRGASMPLFKITPIATAISRATKDYRGLRLYRRFEKKNSILQHHITIYSTYINNSQMHRKVT